MKVGAKMRNGNNALIMAAKQGEGGYAAPRSPACSQDCSAPRALGSSPAEAMQQGSR